MVESLDRKGKGAMPGEKKSSVILPEWMIDLMVGNRTVVSATTGSLCSTMLGYPLDSIKSRMQATKGASSSTLSAVTLAVWREEGIRGFWRGVTIPLLTISIVRTTSFSIYGGMKQSLLNLEQFSHYSFTDIALTSFMSGCTAGAMISVASGPFELVKVRRQLDYQIAQLQAEQQQQMFNNKSPSTTSAASSSRRGIHSSSTIPIGPGATTKLDRPPLNSWQAVQEIIKMKGIFGMWTGFKTHFIRDGLGTGLYFMEYDLLRKMFGRSPNGDQGKPPSWLPIAPSMIPFVCGSIAGVSSWALIYPIDAIKTNIQQRSLSGLPDLGISKTFVYLVKGADPLNPQPISVGFMRLYRGLGVSAIRSCITHGMLWLIVDKVSTSIDRQGLQLMESREAALLL